MYAYIPLDTAPEVDLEGTRDVDGVRLVATVLPSGAVATATSRASTSLGVKEHDRDGVRVSAELRWRGCDVAQTLFWHSSRVRPVSIQWKCG